MSASVDLEPILAVAGKLAAPFDLTTMLAEVVAAAKQVLKVERGTVWLYDREADELVLRFSEDVASMRIPAGMRSRNRSRGAFASGKSSVPMRGRKI